MPNIVLGAEYSVLKRKKRQISYTKDPSISVCETDNKLLHK